MGCVESSNDDDWVPDLSPQEEKEILAAFRMIDTDNSGYITFDELKVAMKDCTKADYTEERVARMMRVADKNRDGRINYSEYVKMLKGY
ncbi:calmodulin, striated muscle-like [Saccoglossus kowalevskii]|uniref:Troponin C, slow skeletal and cardiac muscles-like n=1 Tax=Saccoglossus kowalevskii TaxID=10224 RepID=A0ABM0GYR6_SACKO|nr:PREDICTED: troponin C, slow skeletal and cardiac muscles-like [Saccoglossus kowalevskii]